MKIFRNVNNWGGIVALIVTEEEVGDEIAVVDIAKNFFGYDYGKTTDTQH